MECEHRTLFQYCIWFSQATLWWR